MPRAIILVVALGLLVGCFARAEQSTEIEQDWPTSCDDAIAKLSSETPRSEQIKLAAMERDDLILVHHGFGTRIRNEFGLWDGNFALIESCSGSPDTHPDDVSMTIVELLWARLQ